MNKNIKLIPLDISLIVCRMLPKAEIPEWINDVTDDFISVTRTPEELSIVCPEKLVTGDVYKNTKIESGWKAFKVKGQLDFNLTGILSSIAAPLSNNMISIFAISTYNTDYVLVKKENFKKALKILSNNFMIEKH